METTIKMRQILIGCMCIALTFSSQLHVNSLEINFSDISKSVTDTTNGILSKLPDVIPSPDDLFQSTKNVIAGYPFDIMSRAINQFCK